MNRSTVTALTVAGLLSLGALSVYAGSDAPVDKGGMPPSTEMNAGSGPENALPPGTIEGGNGGDADGSSTSPGTSGGSSAGSGAESGKADSSGSSGTEKKE
ncbi:hypothetical protein D3C84_723240 [compost metagenome]